MLKKPNCPVIAIEEHYWDRELSATYSGVEGVRNPQMMEQLHDLGDLSTGHPVDLLVAPSC